MKICHQDHLARVSRSFALCIPQLPYPLCDQVSLSYLLCRVLDTIEDSQWPSSEQQQAHYASWRSFLRQMPGELELQNWIAGFPSENTVGELALIADTRTLLDHLHGLSAEIQSAMGTTVDRMAQGMAHYSMRRTLSPGPLLIHPVILNQYCYFVAGIVGELITQLYHHHNPDFVPPSAHLKNAVHFGLFLQRINLLKDQYVDRENGRAWLIQPMDAYCGLGAHARGALNYLLALPPGERGFRLFCGVSLYIGLYTVPVITQRQTDHSQQVPKISRTQVQTLERKLATQIQDNQALEAKFHQAIAQWPAEPSESPRIDPAQFEEEIIWMRHLKHPQLNESDLQELGLIV